MENPPNVLLDTARSEYFSSDDDSNYVIYESDAKNQTMPFPTSFTSGPVYKNTNNGSRDLFDAHRDLLGDITLSKTDDRSSKICIDLLTDTGKEDINTQIPSYPTSLGELPVNDTSYSEQLANTSLDPIMVSGRKHQKFNRAIQLDSLLAVKDSFSNLFDENTSLFELFIAQELKEPTLQQLKSKGRVLSEFLTSLMLSKNQQSGSDTSPDLIQHQEKESSHKNTSTLGNHESPHDPECLHASTPEETLPTLKANVQQIVPKERTEISSLLKGQPLGHSQEPRLQRQDRSYIFHSRSQSGVKAGNHSKTDKISNLIYKKPKKDFLRRSRRKRSKTHGMRSDRAGSVSSYERPPERDVSERIPRVLTRKSSIPDHMTIARATPQVMHPRILVKSLSSPEISMRDPESFDSYQKETFSGSGIKVLNERWLQFLIPKAQKISTSHLYLYESVRKWMNHATFFMKSHKEEFDICEALMHDLPNERIHFNTFLYEEGVRCGLVPKAITPEHGQLLITFVYMNVNNSEILPAIVDKFKTGLTDITIVKLLFDTIDPSKYKEIDHRGSLLDLEISSLPSFDGQENTSPFLLLCREILDKDLQFLLKRFHTEYPNTDQSEQLLDQNESVIEIDTSKIVTNSLSSISNCVDKLCHGILSVIERDPRLMNNLLLPFRRMVLVFSLSIYYTALRAASSQTPLVSMRFPVDIVSSDDRIVQYSVQQLLHVFKCWIGTEEHMIRLQTRMNDQGTFYTQLLNVKSELDQLVKVIY